MISTSGPQERADQAQITGGLPYGEPFEAPTFVGSVEVNAGESDSLGASRSAEAVFRFNDQARGEVRRPVVVVPRVDVKIDPSTELWATNSVAPQRFTVTLVHGARDTTTGTVSLRLPRGWPPVAPQRFAFTQPDERATFDFLVKPPGSMTTGSVEMRAFARDSEDRVYDVGVFTVDYPHIRPRAFVKPASATVRIAPLALPRLARVGYVRGAADQVPEALSSVGVPVVLLSPETLGRGNLARFDAIVVGPRAYETDSSLVANNRRLLAYVRGGGLLIVQYQQHRFFTGQFAPLSHDSRRTTGESRSRHRRESPRSHPGEDAPRHPGPNRLTSSDWGGWVQERGSLLCSQLGPSISTGAGNARSG